MDTAQNRDVDTASEVDAAPRITARFQPEAWIDDYAVPVDGAYDFDVTDQVLALGREKALAIEDASNEADALWQGNPISDERPHAGPFDVYVEDSIRDYFDALDAAVGNEAA